MITEQFRALAAAASGSLGLKDPPLVVLPAVFEKLPAARIPSLVDEYCDELAAKLAPGRAATGKDGPAAPAAPSAPSADRLDVEDCFAWSLEQRAGDGLPVVAPTPDLVARFVRVSGRSADEVVTVLPPRWGSATVEKIAANAAMAGCLPEYFPVVLAAVEAMEDPALDVGGIHATTGPTALMVIVNGPIIRRLSINGGYGCLGPGWRANATIGRAVALVQRNIGGMLPGEVSMSTHGQPGRYTFCMAENEDESPWAPYHVDLGYGADESTVTLTGIVSRCTLMHRGLPDETPDDYVSFYGAAVGPVLSEVIGGGWRALLVVLNPGHARRFADGGWSKERVRQAFYQQANVTPIDRYSEHLQRDVAERWSLVENGHIKMLSDPSQVSVWVAGGSGGHHSILFSARSLPVTRRIDDHGRTAT